MPGHQGSVVVVTVEPRQECSASVGSMADDWRSTKGHGVSSIVIRHNIGT